MKKFVLLAVLLALFTTPVFAYKNSQTVTIAKTTKAGTVDLAPGEYDMSWTGTAPDVQVTFSMQHKAVVTLPAKVVMESNKEEFVETKGDKGYDALDAVRTKKQTFHFQ